MCVCLCACHCEDADVCCVQANWLTSWRDGSEGQGELQLSSSLPCRTVGVGRARAERPSNHDLPQDPGFWPANTILSQRGCSEASRGYIIPWFSTGITAQVFLAGPAWISSCSNSKVLCPSQICKWVGKPATRGEPRILDVTYHPRDVPLRCVREDRLRRAAGR